MKYDHLKFARKFIAIAIIVITVVICSIFLAFNARSEKLTISVIHQQAKSLFNQVILIRRWVTEHGGVYVKVRPGVDPNPYLTKMPGLKVNIIDQSGALYTLRNPGVVTREISEFSSHAEGYYFHIASLKPVNPATNTPDDFERTALKKFEDGTKEYFVIEKRADGPVYRYMAPLYYESSCNRCHSHQGYSNGDIRGGISVTIPMKEVAKKMQNTRLLMAGAAGIVLLLLLGTLYIISRKFMEALKETQQQLVDMAISDTLTGLMNRRAGLLRIEEELARQSRTGLAVSCLLLDLDHFKLINDTMGHPAGDAVLVRFAEILGKCLRKYDIVCRYGGEEFLVVMPDCPLSGAISAAEKICRAAVDEIVAHGDSEIRFTTSIGVAERLPGETVKELISRADKALYIAKKQGRNRVVPA